MMASESKPEQPAGPPKPAISSAADDPVLREADRHQQGSLTHLRMAAERHAGLLAVKRRGAQREQERALARDDKLRAQALSNRIKNYARLEGRAKVALNMAWGRENLSEAFGKRAAAFGHVEDAEGKAQEGIPVAILVQGKAVATSRTDHRGAFSLAVPAGTSGEAILQIGEQGKLATRALTLEGRPLVPSGIAVRVSGASKPASTPVKS
jgi:hypothetical protein